MTIILFTALCLGCTSAYQEEHRRAYWQRQSGEMTQTEYGRAMMDLKQGQPWGGIGGVHEDDGLPFFFEP